MTIERRGLATQHEITQETRAAWRAADARERKRATVARLLFALASLLVAWLVLR